jgi:cytochrome b561
MPRYSTVAIILHWLIALLIICAFTLGVTMTNMHGLSPAKLKFFSWHKWLGCTVFGVACLRGLWRLWHTPPPYPMAMPAWQKTAASAVHGLLYFLIFAVPLSGYVYKLAAGIPVVYLGLFPLPVFIDPNPEWKPILKLVHYWLNVILLGGFCLHVLAALNHQFIVRDNILKRMWP